MPLVPNAQTSPFQSTFAVAASAVQTVKDVDQQVKTESLAEAKKVVTADIASKLAEIAAEVQAERRSSSGSVTLSRVAFDQKTVPESTSLSEQQFQRRSSDNFTRLLENCDPGLLDSEVLTPIANELEAAGFTGVKFEKVGEYIQHLQGTVKTLRLTVELPTV